jgi:hypothetical protein
VAFNSPPSTPSIALCTLPNSIRSSIFSGNIRWNGKRITYIRTSHGEIIVLIPIKSPRVFTKAPPLFPGFTACLNERLNSAGSRSLALPKRYRQLPLKLNYGFPTRTHSPTFTESEFPNVVYGSVSSASILARRYPFLNRWWVFCFYDFLLFRVISISEASLIRDYWSTICRQR